MPTRPRLAPRPAHWRSAPLAAVCLIAALAGTGCSDQTAPAGAEDAAGLSSSAKGPRTPTISYLHVEGNTIFVNSGQVYLTADVELTNPGGKQTNLSLQGLVQQGLNSVTMTSLSVHCSDTEGALPHGTCLMLFQPVGPDAGLTSGPAQFVLRLLKDGTGQIASSAVTADVFRF